ncbi:carbohydrate ABC transporter permease [Streptacidiphilus carbonis]|jgi:multiple sugar transport system permease protein|uniref:carbohydrate ABC transporter permease n=1 Tax=Streptacidiphilus carbonis TaxID=105422 RepID=UPI000A039265|nr:carbohydrate ABC transporter permease [Streptacidiphilus carbonis]
MAATDYRATDRAGGLARRIGAALKGADEDEGGRRARWTPGRVALLVVALALAVLWVVPLLWALATSAKPEAETATTPLHWLGSVVTFAAYRKVWEAGDIGQWMLNSLFVSVMVTLLTLALTATAAYGFARTEFKGKKVLYGLVMAGVMVPPQVLLIPLFEEMVSMHLVDTYWGVILPQLVAPAMVFIMVKFFQGLPRELEEAAFVDGAGRWRVFWTIIMPLSRPVLSAVGIFTFIGSWNNFLWPFLVLNDPKSMTLPVGLVTVQSSYGVMYAQVMAAAIIAGLPLLVIFVLFQRQIVRGVAHTGLAGQ